MKKGFTVLETIVSLWLVALAFIFLIYVFSFSYAQIKKSSALLQGLQKTAEIENVLLALPFDAPELAVGEHQQNLEAFTIKWRCTLSSEYLKQFDLSVGSRLFHSTVRFYKSAWIKEVTHD